MNEIIERISIAIEASRSCGKEDCERCGEIAKIFGSIEAAEKALDALKAGQAYAELSKTVNSERYAEYVAARMAFVAAYEETPE